MRIVRHGNPRGLDRDYKVFVKTADEIERLHETLKSKRFLFLYQRGDKAFDPDSNSLIVLHYIDPHLKLYDYAFVFQGAKYDEAERPKSAHNIELDKAYAKARKDPEFAARLRKYMELHSLLHAFWKHLRAYGGLSEEHGHVLKKILRLVKKETGQELDGAPSIEALQNLGLRIKHFFGI